MWPPLCGIFFGAHLLIAVVADEVPKFDFMPSCRGAAKQAEASRAAGIVESCANGERNARDEIAKTWSQFAISDKTRCSQSTRAFAASYVELLTCLQTAAEAKKLPKQ
jgi:hypothetical protein